MKHTQMSSSVNQSAETISGNVSSRHRVVEVERGIPKFCRCGAKLVVRTSNSIQNPGRLFQRCPYGTERDKYHFFQWTDEAMVEEFEILNEIASELKGEMESLEIETRACEAFANSYSKDIKDMKDRLRGYEKEMKVSNMT